MKTILPQVTENQKESFKLINKSYSTPNKKHFSITKEQLEYLAERVEGPEGVVEKICKEKI